MNGSLKFPDADQQTRVVEALRDVRIGTHVEIQNSTTGIRWFGDVTKFSSEALEVEPERVSRWPSPLLIVRATGKTPGGAFIITRVL